VLGDSFQSLGDAALQVCVQQQEELALLLSLLNSFNKAETISLPAPCCHGKIENEYRLQRKRKKGRLFYARRSRKT